MLSRGHLFVVQADLTRLAADAFIIPCDTDLNVAGGWRPFLEPGAEAQESGQWFTPRGVKSEDGFRYLPDTTPGVDRPAPDQVVGLRVLVDTVTAESIPAMVQHSLAAVRFAAGKAERRGGRALPLIALPILGVGQGNFPGQRVEVLRELIAQLLNFVSRHPIDVALVLRRPADFAAAEWARSQVPDADAAAWPELSAAQLALADRLGGQAAHGELSLFVGAGVSKPVGFPDWQDLLQELARRRLKFTSGTDYPKLAQKLRIRKLNARISQRFQTSKHALGHALLADLRTQAMVTTNYDPCLENALAAIHVDPPLRVLARELAVGSHPWLLKLHGDIAHPATIVLTSRQYERLTKDHNALRGVVQSLMLTSHLLFVGFGFADNDFLAMSTAVQKVRSLAQEATLDAKVGTAIELRESSKHPYTELDYQHMSPAGSDVPEAARLLEILLDRLTWRCQVTNDARAAFLLDPDYQEGQKAEDVELRDKLLELYEVANRHHGSAGYDAVTDLLRALGHPDSTGSGATKVCVVLEEAHTVIPEWNFIGIGEKNAQSLVNSIGQIALQGRKFNIGFIVIAQRTANVSKTILTQCNTIVAFQEFDNTSRDFLLNYLGKEMVNALPNLKFKQAIAVGKAFKSSVPLIFEVPEIKEG